MLSQRIFTLWASAAGIQMPCFCRWKLLCHSTTPDSSSLSLFLCLPHSLSFSCFNKYIRLPLSVSASWLIPSFIAHEAREKSCRWTHAPEWAVRRGKYAGKSWKITLWPMNVLDLLKQNTDAHSHICTTLRQPKLTNRPKVTETEGGTILWNTMWSSALMS